MSASGLPTVNDIEALAALLPPFPKVVLELLSLMRDEQASFEVMARLIRNDAVLSGNILSLANHIRRMRAQPDLSDPFAAASLIGMNHVRRIVVSVGMNRFIGGGRGSEFFFHHSFAVALATQELALICEVPPDEAYIAGILHDVGQLCFHVLDERGFQQAYELSSVDGRLIEREAALFGQDHCEVGAQLAAYWNLPDEVLAAIRMHHDEKLTAGRLQAAVCLGETLARALDLPSSPRNRVTHVNTDAMELLGVHWDAPELSDCFGRCRARFRHGTA